MTETILRRPALQNDLYIRSKELPGAPAPAPQDPDEAERATEALVHQLIIEEKRRVKPTHLPEILPQQDLPTQSKPVERESAQESIAQILKAERAVEAAQGDAKRRRIGLPSMRLPWVKALARGRADRSAAPAASRQTAPNESRTRRLPIPQAVRGYRPTRKHIALAVLAGLIVYRPLLVPLVLLVTVWVVLIAYLTVGPDRWGEIIANAWLRLKARRPEMAERLRLRADRYAETWDKVLDWLPDAWADRLALPDFSAYDPNAEPQPDPFDRLAVEAREAQVAQ